MNQLVSIGIKVLAAVGVGAAVYFGLDKVAKPKKQEPSQPRNNNNCGCNNENCNCSQVNNNPNLNCSNQQPNEGQVEMRTEDKIVHGLKTAQEVCGRAFSLCQNLAVAAENIIKIFGGGNNTTIIIIVEVIIIIVVKDQIMDTMTNMVILQVLEEFPHIF